MKYEGLGTMYTLKGSFWEELTPDTSHVSSFIVALLGVVGVIRSCGALGVGALGTPRDPLWMEGE